MSKCLICGNELVTGDTHWEMGLCNQCWNVCRHERMPIPQYVDMLNKENYELQNENLKQQLAEKDKQIFMLKCIVKKEHPEIEGITDTNNGLTMILYKIVSADEKEIRKQVCDEIMRIVNVTDMQTFGTRGLEVNKYIKNIIDQVEKGEQQ